MRLIDNLEELEVDDFVSSNMGTTSSVVFRVKLVTDKFIHIGEMKTYRYKWNSLTANRDRSKYTITYSNPNTSEGERIIFKTRKKIKKRKLKHKVVTYNNDWVIFKLTDKEKNKVIKEGILDNLK